jgi:hypothetical protein
LGPSCSLEGTTGYLKSNVSFMTITGPWRKCGKCRII